MAAATSRFLDKIQGRLNCIYQEDGHENCQKCLRMEADPQPLSQKFNNRAVTQEPKT